MLAFRHHPILSPSSCVNQDKPNLRHWKQPVHESRRTHAKLTNAEIHVDVAVGNSVIASLYPCTSSITSQLFIAYVLVYAKEALNFPLLPINNVLLSDRSHV